LLLSIRNDFRKWRDRESWLDRTNRHLKESQGVKLQLPMSEDQFLELLKRLNLSYDLQTIIPTPWHSKKLDVSKMQRAYQIYGKTDRARQVAEMYRAYVDESGRVVYIENMFGYFGSP